MTKRITAEPDEIAAHWVARIDRGVSASEQAELSDWLAADERHLGAYVRARAFFIRTEVAQALGPGFKPENFTNGSEYASWGAAIPLETMPKAHHRRAVGGGLSRRRILHLGSVAAAAGLGGIGSAWFWLNDREHYATRRGEVRTVALSDGSTVVLNAESEIVVAYATSGRAIFLRCGEALFDVAKDATRPFTVHAGIINATAVGTTFTVSRAHALGTRVVVNEGLVDVRETSDSRGDAMRLGVNMSAVAPSHGPLHSELLEDAAVQRELQWREGRIEFASETLEAAAAQFTRYSDVAIVIDDPGLRHEEISGTFIALDPIGFSRAVAEALDAQVEVREGEVHLYRKRI